MSTHRVTNMKTKRDDGKWNLRMSPAAAAEIRAFLKRTGWKQGPFFERAGLKEIKRAKRQAA